MIEKQIIRAQYKQLRNRLDEEEINTYNQKIFTQIQKLNFLLLHRYFHIFLPILKHKEVDTYTIINYLREQKKTILVSKTNWQTMEMSHYIFDDSIEIEINSFDIPEPISGVQVETKMIEVIFVPLLAFDQQGHRVGYGKGFYDRLLKQCTPQSIKIGLSYFDATTDFILTNHHDVKLNFCITPNVCYKF